MFDGVFMGLGVYLILRTKGEAKILDVSRRGGENLRRIVRGGQKFFDRRYFQNPWVK